MPARTIGVPLNISQRGRGVTGATITTDNLLANLPPTNSVVGAAQVLAAEAALSITPAIPSFPVWPFIDPQRYGGDPSGNTADVATTTTGVQNAINVAQYMNGVVWIGDGCNYICNALTATFTGSRNTDSLMILGASMVGSRITQASTLTSGALLTAQGGSGATPIEANFTLANVGLFGTGSNVAGLLLQNIGEWTIERVNTNTFLYGFQLESALIGEFNGCVVDGNVNGYYARLYAGGAYNNLVNINGGRIISNTTYGADVDRGQSWHFNGVDIEGNGSTSSPTAPTSGGVIIRSTASAEAGVALMSFYQCWFEQNNGWACQTENVSGLQLSLRDCDLFGNGANQAGVLYVAGAGGVTVDMCRTSAATSDVVTIGAAQGDVGVFVNIGTLLSSITDNSTYPWYSPVFLNLGSATDARVTNPTLTLSNGATGAVAVKQNGLKVTVIASASINGTGVFTPPLTATGIVAPLIPSVSRTVQFLILNNGVTQSGWVTIAQTTGTMTLFWNGGAQTSGQNNGFAVGEFSYDL
jgi:hypothetical protein